MQLPPDDELVLVSGCHPIRAKKARYYEDRQLQARILPPPKPRAAVSVAGSANASPPRDASEWQELIVARASTDDPDNAGIRREPELPEHEEIAPEPRRPAQEFELPEDDPDDDAQRLRALQRQVRTIARQATLDPGDDMGL